MPGSSLWLMPPARSSLNPLFPLIEKTSSHFNSPHRFLPHVTLTSEILPAVYGQSPQSWLDSLDLPTGNEITVKYEKLDSENVFFRKLYIKCERTAGLKQLATCCRQRVDGFEDKDKAVRWAEKSYNPHLSLLYHDCPAIDAQGLSEVEDFAKDLGVDVHGEEGLRGWEGGRVVLVPTDKPIDQWSPIAERIL